MEFNNEEFLKDRDQSKQQNTQPKAWREEADINLSEKDLERELFTKNDEMKPIREGEGTGGENFGKNNLTPSANDKNNPSQYAGNNNAYLDRTEPSEEHPEDSNFKPTKQNGEPDYDKAQFKSNINTPEPKTEKAEIGNGDGDLPHKSETYKEGTVDNDEVNIPGPGELPDQQKVGEDNGGDEKDKLAED